MKSINASQLLALYDNPQDIMLIDVRNPAEFSEVHVQGALNIPLDQLDAVSLLKSIPHLKSEPLYIICRSGVRSQTAGQKMMEAGFTNLINIDGGTLACIQAGLPLVSPQQNLLS